jgi:ribosomal protein S18 acetylase RimI-like enzyme
MIIIRKATDHDLLDLCNIEKTCFEFDLLSKQSLRNFINHKCHSFLIAEKNNKIVGYLLTLLISKHKFARQYSLAILPDFQRQSIGRQLLLASESCVNKKLGIKLETRTDNIAAINLYQSLGYKTGKVKYGYYMDGCDALEMIKLLIK